MKKEVLRETNFSGLNLIKRGKVRDVYEVDGKLLIVASDRISAYDVVMDDPIPDKGKILTQMSLFWFDKVS
ncbi:MAG: phosphoribosylaminoimidazolesuccinocarboxamide synthase, partial [Deltaproteobacteria bacterium]|nr:phosphoribosylaminoimidazolesuccinocarboxamide synthase [Deltaproteobacteria bacterium]